MTQPELLGLRFLSSNNSSKDSCPLSLKGILWYLGCILNAWGKIFSVGEISLRSYCSRWILEPDPCLLWVDSHSLFFQSSPKIPHGSSSRGAYNYTHRAKSLKSDKPSNDKWGFIWFVNRILDPIFSYDKIWGL